MCRWLGVLQRGCGARGQGTTWPRCSQCWMAKLQVFVCLQLSCSPVLGAAPLQRGICSWSCLDAAGSMGTRLHPPHHYKPQLCSCGTWVELQNVPWERNPGLSSTNKKQISSRNEGQEISVPWATACTTAGLAPLGMVLLLCWPQPLVSPLGLAQQPPTLPCSPTCQQMSFFRAHHAQRLICAQTRGTGMGSWVLERFWGWEELNQSISALWPQMGGMFPLTSLPSGQDLSRLIFKYILG